MKNQHAVQDAFSWAVLGSGPAALMAAALLSRERQDIALVSDCERAGGVAASPYFQGYWVGLDDWGPLPVDKVSTDEAAEEMWLPYLAAMPVGRVVRSHIYYRDRLFEVPFTPTNAPKHMGPIAILQLSASYLRQQLGQTLHAASQTAALSAKDQLERQFGSYLHKHFFAPYLQKLWGIESDRIMADSLDTTHDSLAGALLSGLTFTGSYPTEHYPKYGYQELWRGYQRAIQQTGGAIIDTCISRLIHRQGRIVALEREEVGRADSSLEQWSVQQLLCDWPLPRIVERLYPSPPADVQTAAQQIQYRHLITVVLRLNVPELFEGQRITINASSVRAVQVIKFSPDEGICELPDGECCIGIQYLCDDAAEGEKEADIWAWENDALVDMAKAELLSLRMIWDEGAIAQSCVLRKSHAVRVPSIENQAAIGIVEQYLHQFHNLTCLDAPSLSLMRGGKTCAPLSQVWQTTQRTCKAMSISAQTDEAIAASMQPAVPVR